MKNTRQHAAGILAVVAGLLLGQMSLACTQHKLSPLKVGVLKMAALTNPWTAKERGMFKKQGLDVTLIEFRTGNEAVAAHRGGSVDIVLSIPGTAMTAVERGFDLLAISQNEVAKARGLTPVRPGAQGFSLQVVGRSRREEDCRVRIAQSEDGRDADHIQARGRRSLQVATRRDSVPARLTRCGRNRSMRSTPSILIPRSSSPPGSAASSPGTMWSPSPSSRSVPGSPNRRSSRPTRQSGGFNGTKRSKSRSST